MHDRHHIRPRAINLGMDEALEENLAAACIDRVAVLVELHDVLGGNQRGRERARHQEV